MLTLEAEDMGELEKALQHVAYLNSRQFPTPGVRRLRLASVVRCVLLSPRAPEECVWT